MGDDLKNYRAPDAFAPLADDLVALALFGIGIAILVFWPTT